ncbi:redox-regulated ATPase YchF, partial [Candidatus Woesearchaeota archaeon]|nr:redox-regulated ATPase YchF [Candidatus Woesearchaeota archaeon]
MVGVVGKPSSGKSTFFKAATLADVEIANYPFTTIKPNHAVGFVRVDCACKDFSKKCNPRTGFCKDSVRFVPVDMIDVAGLVPGAHKGHGMGNQFLDDLRQADVLVHIIDVSGSVNEKGEPVESLSYDPANDIKFLEDELDFWFLGIFQKVWDKFSRQVQQEHGNVVKSIAKQFSGLKVTDDIVKDALKNNNLNDKPIVNWTEDDLKNVVKHFRKATKPIIIAANKSDVKGSHDNFERLKKEFSDHMIIPTSAESELALKEAAKHKMIDYVPGNNDFTIKDGSKLNEKQTKGLEFIKTNILNKFGSTGVQDVLDKAVFELLKFISVFPVATAKLEDKDGNILPDCFLLPKTTTALDLAFAVHTDIGNNFVKAINIKKNLPVGKDQPLEDRDVIEILSTK